MMTTKPLARRLTVIAATCAVVGVLAACGATPDADGATASGVSGISVEERPKATEDMAEGQDGISDC